MEKVEIFDYLEMIENAMSNVKKDYFDIVVMCSEQRKKRERVYCYELYHQIRKIQDKKPKLFLHSINAEIDKSGHKLFPSGFNPDFVFHKQGSMENNYLVVEVKTAYKKEGIKKDFDTIRCMLKCCNYQYGLFILTGYSMEWFETKVLSIINADDYREIASKIFVLTQKSHDSKIIRKSLEEIIA